MADKENNVSPEEQEEVETVEAEEVKIVDSDSGEQTEEEASPESSEAADSELEKKVQEAQDRVLRIQADYDNFRRRTRQEKEAAAKYKSQQLAESLLPALDNFERALNMEPESEEAKNLYQGMKMVHQQMLEALRSEGVEPMEVKGQEFDPHLHEAVMQVEEEGFDSNVVVEELQKGYMLKDKVIRPAMVKVNG
nr:nucleotide exchange factor GrpE [Alkalicoccus urumqiensis]